MSSASIWRTHVPSPAGFRSAEDQIRSVAQSCPTLCDPMNRSTPGLPVHHQLPEIRRTQSGWEGGGAVGEGGGRRAPRGPRTRPAQCPHAHRESAFPPSPSEGLLRPRPRGSGLSVTTAREGASSGKLPGHGRGMLEEGVCYDLCVFLAKLY